MEGQGEEAWGGDMIRKSTRLRYIKSSHRRRKGRAGGKSRVSLGLGRIGGTGSTLRERGELGD